MNLKTIIIIVLLIGIMIFIYREFSNLNKTVDDQFVQVKYLIKDNTNLKKQLQNNFDNQLEKIKLINTESIQQVRKMNIIQNEPIRKSSNYYTENDSDYESDHELANGIKYLSESTYDNKINKEKKENNEFYPYMSQEENMSKKEFDLVANMTKSTFGMNDNKNCIIIDSDEIIENVDPLIVIVDNFGNSCMNSSKKNIIYHNSIKNQSEQNNVPKTTFDMQIESEEKQQNSIHDITINQQIENGDNINIIINDDNVDVNDNANNEENNVDINNKEKEAKSIEQNDITLNKNDEDDEEKSVVTVELEGINKSTLKNIKYYKMESLKKIAKYNNIPLSVKENGKYKSYNKTELYSKIKKALSGVKK